MIKKVTLVIPSLNQGQFLEKAIVSTIQQDLPIELFVMDGGSTDNTISIINKHSSQITDWKSSSDSGQASAINEGVSRGCAEYIYWLNSDDWLLPNGLLSLANYLDTHPDCPAVYGRVWNYDEHKQTKKAIWVEPFSEKRLALRCIISQPGTLIRRSVWEALGGLNVSLDMVMDYDLWWRIFKSYGPLHFIEDFVAVNRDHMQTKTNSFRKKHYNEAIQVVKKYYGVVPLKWWLLQPYSVWYKSMRQ